jgi:hypothetical protein
MTMLIYQIPIGTWPKDPRLKELGMYQLEQMCASVEPFILALLTRFLGWSHIESGLDSRRKTRHAE